MAIVLATIAALCPGEARAQDRPQLLSIHGRVTAGSRPVQNAQVSVSDSTARRAEFANTDSAGRYTLVIPAGAGRIDFVVTRLGYAPARQQVHVTDDLRVLEVDFQLSAAVQELPAVRSVGVRPRPRRDDLIRSPRPGATEIALDVTSGLTGDLTGDLDPALAMIPGIVLTADANGRFLPSAFGLGPDQNSITLNGLDFSGARLPRDGLRQTVRLSTYDPRNGRFSGVQIAASLGSGAATATRSLHATAAPALLQWTTPVASQAGIAQQTGILSGSLGGTLVPYHMFFNTAFQIERRAGDLATLTSSSGGALEALGINPDSARAAAANALALGMPVDVPGTPSARTSTSGSGMVRIDLTPNAQGPVGPSGAVTYLLGSGSFTTTGGLGGGLTSAPSRMSRSTHRDGQLMFSFSPYLLAVLNETKVSVSMSDDETTPYRPFPAASVLLRSTLPDGRAGAAPVWFGGSGATQQHLRQLRWQGSTDVSWMTLSAAHRFNLRADAGLADFSLAQENNSLGTFSYNSLADFAANRPAVFSRAPGMIESRGRAWEGALAVGDVFTPNERARAAAPLSDEGLRLQYGFRIDGRRFAARPARNRLVDSLFSVRNDHVPNTLTVEPMLGFTWNRGAYTVSSGRATFSDTRSSLTGGIREYHGTIAPLAVSTATRQTGLPSAAQQFTCVGEAVPTPDWFAYADSLGALPSACANGGIPSPLVDAAPPVTLYAPDYAVSRSWRGELRWRWLFSGQFAGTMGMTEALNLNQPGLQDLNFEPTVRFTLADEAGRPVFVPASGIAANTGAVGIAGSRKFSDFSRVTELVSDLRSEQRLFTGGFEYRFQTTRFLSSSVPNPPRFNATLGVNYTYADTRARTRGFGGTTAGDPRAAVWGPGATARHTIQAVLNGRLDRWFSITASARWTSGFRYTPRVRGDINGDGFANDRAFIFDPAGATDPLLAADLRTLLATAPSRAARCLRAQLGRLAARNSCQAPWSMSLGTIAIAMDPYRLHLGNRGTFTIYVDNFLGGLDQALHGDHLHGWGTVAFPDPTLLDVRGFDPASHRFQYSVNPQFGATTQSIFRQPFRITLDLRLDVGPDQETAYIRVFARGRSGSRSPAELERTLKLYGSRNDLAIILRRADSLALTVAQRDSIVRLGARFNALRDSLYGSLATYLVGLDGELGGESVRQHWHGAMASIVRARFAMAGSVRALLRPEQLQWLRSHNLAASLDYSRDWLERRLRGPLGPS